MITPVLTVGAMYFAKELKKDFSMTENFVFNMSRIQGNFMSSQSQYSRSADQMEAPEPRVPGHIGRAESE